MSARITPSRAVKDCSQLILVLSVMILLEWMQTKKLDSARATSSNGTMIGKVFLNGRIVPAEVALVSVFDRGFMYGEGLFETLRISKGVPFQWLPHWTRLTRGIEALGIATSFGSEEALQTAIELSKINAIPEGILRLSVSRGIGARGYSPKGAHSPTWVMSLGAFPSGQSSLGAESPVRWRAVTSQRIRLQPGPLASLKTANRLPQILARMEADEAGVDEAIVCDSEGNVVEASGANVFWIRDAKLHTPPIELGGLPGIARATVFELAASLGVEVKETVSGPSLLCDAEGVFLSLSTYGVIELVELDGRDLKCHPLSHRLWREWEALVGRETGQRS